MTDETRRERAVVELLRQVGASERERAPTRHPDQTDACLTLAELDNALDRGFDQARRPHVPGCLFCQKLFAMRWRMDCPAVALVLRHLAPSSPFSAAFAEHVELDGCRRCQRLTNSRLLKALAGGLRPGGGHPDVDCVAADYAPLPAVIGAFASLPRGGDRADSEPGWPFRLRVTASGGLSATLRQTDRDALVVHVQSADPADAGRTVDVEVAGEGESLEASVVLRKRGRRFEGRHTFGRLGDLRPFLGPSCALIIVARDVPATPPRP